MTKCKTKWCGYSSPKPLEVCPRCDTPFDAVKAAKKAKAEAKVKTAEAKVPEPAPHKGGTEGQVVATVANADGSITHVPGDGHVEPVVVKDATPVKKVAGDVTPATLTPQSPGYVPNKRKKGRKK